MKPVLEIQHISKKFAINHEQQPYLSLRDSISTFFKQKQNTEEFWALNDVSFNVEAGDTIGIIGKNGAGKSTLLKILSKITPPSAGKIIGRGRIASLLEVGTGFHPELTGRENIFMNGSILGMRRVEILKNFDAIVDFAGVEKFIDTPLKHYSSGMQLRLAFAVAAFLENEILIIDEVLAVGDFEFQNKCMNKMGDVSKSGRTILFVSHNLGAISDLCKNAVLLQKGKVLLMDSTNKVLSGYLNSGLKDDIAYESEKKPELNAIFFQSIFLKKNTGTQQNEFLHNEPILIKMKIFCGGRTEKLKVGIALVNKNKQKVFTNQNWITINNTEIIEVECKIPENFVCPGNYSFDLAVFKPNGETFEYLADKCSFSILDGGSDVYWDQNYGDVFANCEWVQL